MSDILQFYAFSANKPAGKGTGDLVSDPSVYQDLNKIPNWRRMFSSLWSKDPFVFEELHFRSYEHAFQYLKFRSCDCTDFAYTFGLDSGSELSQSSGLEARKHRKDITIPKQKLQVWEDQLDSHKNQLYAAKYTPESRPGQALIFTHKAQLINAGPRIRRIECKRLQRFRDQLQGQ